MIISVNYFDIFLQYIIGVYFMKKSTKILTSVAAAVVVLASIIAVSLFNSGNEATPETTGSVPSTTLFYNMPTETESWFDWDAYLSALDLSNTDPSLTTTDTSGLSTTVPTTNLTPTIVYVYPDDYVPNTNNNQNPNFNKPTTTQKPTTTEPRVEMVDYKYFVNDDGGVTLKKYIGSDETPRIPEEVDGKSVTAIGNSCFKSSDIKGVYIPKSVLKIDTAAFNNCQSLEKVYFLGKNPVEIGDSVFENCIKLNTVSISPAAVSIGANAFSNCKSLKSLTIPYTVTVIGANAFSGCGEDFTIVCEEGSEAYLVAQKYNLKYQLV